LADTYWSRLDGLHGCTSNHQGGQAVSIEELKRENEILKDALCMEQDRLSHARHHLQNAQDRIKRLEEALKETVSWIVDLANSGGAGYLDAEIMPEVIQARAALKAKEAKP